MGPIGFSVNHRVLDTTSSFARVHNHSMEELLLQTRPPDLELADLIEHAFLEGQIDGLKVDLAYSWLQANREVFML